MHLSRPVRAALALVLAALTLSAQQPAPPPLGGVPATVLRVTTRLVLVDRDNRSRMMGSTDAPLVLEEPNKT